MHKRTCNDYSVFWFEIQYYQQNKDGHTDTRYQFSTKELIFLKNDQLKLLKSITVNNIYAYHLLTF